MPTKTGLSHALAAVVVVVVGPILSRLVEVLITTRDIELAVGALADVLSSHPLVPLGSEYTTTGVYVAIVGVLAFIWGYAYHIRRHS
jgi:hypothetical protein